MPISSATSKQIYLGDDVSVDFSFPYKFFNTSDLVVTTKLIADPYTETILAEGDDYTVAGQLDEFGVERYDNGGTVTLTVALASTLKLVIQREEPITQETDFVPNSDFSEQSVEDALDKLTMICQQLQEQVDRCLKFGIDTTVSDTIIDLPDVTVYITDSEVKKVSGTFVFADLVAGVLTINHNFGLTAPYPMRVTIFGSDNKERDGFDVHAATNTVDVDLSAFGTITGTWAYLVLA